MVIREVSRIPYVPLRTVTIHEWRFPHGAVVAQGDTICQLLTEIEISEHPFVKAGQLSEADFPDGETTVKGYFDMTCRTAGILHHCFPAGTVVKMDDVIFTING